MRNSPILAATALSILAFLFAGKQASAAVIYSTGFELPTFSTGALAGQGGWDPASFGTVEGSTVYAGTQAVGFDASNLPVGQYLAGIALSSSSQGTLMQVSDKFYYNGDMNVAWFPLGLFSGNPQFFLGQLVIYQGSAELGLASGAFVGNVPVTSGAWHNYTMYFNFTTGMQSAYVDGTFIAQGALPNGATSLTEVESGINYLYGASTNQAYVDNVLVSTVPDPTTIALVGVGLLGLGFTRRKRAG